MTRGGRRAAPVFVSLWCAVASAVSVAEDLDALFRSLREAPSVEAAGQVEARIWALWSQSGDARVDALLAEGIVDMQAGELEAAADIFTLVVEAKPDFAEGWNKRATVLYLMDELDRSVADIQRTLALEPRHFGAISGMGLIFLERGDLAGALGAFEQVLAIHPRSRSARVHVERIRELLRPRAA